MTTTTKLGHALRESAIDAHDGTLPHISMAYGFLLDNPECFEDFASIGMDCSLRYSCSAAMSTMCSPFPAPSPPEYVNH